jgi:uncharacterized protein
MDMTPQILTGKVMHRRLFPKENGFVYGIYYVACPLSRLHELNDGWRFCVDRPALCGLYAKDHGPRDGSNIEDWARGVLQDHDIDATGEIVLVTMPRVLGHVFNPVSFWLCFDTTETLRAVLCEVNNTFGERHTYICALEDGGEITAADWLTAEKMFHVSPFLPREGLYRFRFDVTGPAFGVWIDYYATDGRKQLLTTLTGRLAPYTPAAIRTAFWRHPMVCLAALARIHMQAARLFAKGISYVPRPRQKTEKVSRGGKITNL